MSAVQGYRFGSPPHGGVDRNPEAFERIAEWERRPLTGAWIETLRHHRRHRSP